MKKAQSQIAATDDKEPFQANAYLTGDIATAFARCLKDSDPLRKSQLARQLIKEALSRRGYLPAESNNAKLLEITD